MQIDLGAVLGGESLVPQECRRTAANFVCKRIPAIAEEDLLPRVVPTASFDDVLSLI